MKKYVAKIVFKVLYWGLFLFMIYLIFELIRKIFGGSLEIYQINTALIMMNIGLTFHMIQSINKVDAKVSGHIGWHKGQHNSD